VFLLLPISVFVICLQRFSDGEKNQAPICFSENWQPLEKDVEPEHGYALQAVVTHLGQTIDFGMNSSESVLLGFGFNLLFLVPWP
jgi:hypothetical protein